MSPRNLGMKGKMTLRRFRYFTLQLFILMQGCGSVPPSVGYCIGGEDPQALLCRPEGKAPFPAVVHNYGVGVDIQGYQRAVRPGYNLPAICKELAADGFLTFIPIRRCGEGGSILSHKAQVPGCGYRELAWRSIDAHSGSRAKGIESACHNGPSRSWAEFLCDIVPSLCA